MDQLEALDISDSNVALLFLKGRFKGCYLPLKYDTDGDAISAFHLTNKEIVFIKTVMPKIEFTKEDVCEHGLM